MFGGKKAPVIAEQETRDDLYQQVWEYKTLAILGVTNVDKELNAHAARGWELVSAMMAGTIHYAYMRRRLIGHDQGAA